MTHPMSKRFQSVMQTPGLGRRILALCLVLVGLAALWQTMRHLPFGSLSKPDSGFYPTVVSVMLIAFGWLSLTDRTQPPPEEEGAVDGQARVWLTIAALAIYAGALATVGFVVCTAGLIVFLLRGIGRVSWIASVASAAVASVVCYLAFKRLGLPLPAGLLGFL